MYQGASKLASFLKINWHFLGLANLPIIQFSMTLLLVNTSSTINCVPFNTLMIDSILFTGRSSFHFTALEATFIRTLQPNRCRQQEFVYSFKIFH